MKAYICVELLPRLPPVTSGQRCFAVERRFAKDEFASLHLHLAALGEILEATFKTYGLHRASSSDNCFVHGFCELGSRSKKR